MRKKEFVTRNVNLVFKYSKIPIHVLKRDLTPERIDKLAESLRGANSQYKNDEFPSIVQRHVNTARYEQFTKKKKKTPNRRYSTIKNIDKDGGIIEEKRVSRIKNPVESKTVNQIQITDEMIENIKEETKISHNEKEQSIEEIAGSSSEKGLGNSREEEKHIEQILKKKGENIREIWNFYPSCFYPFSCKYCKKTFPAESSMFRQNSRETFDTECVKKILATTLKIPSEKIPNNELTIKSILNNNLVSYVDGRSYELIEDTQNEKSDVNTDVIINDVIENKLAKIPRFVLKGLMQKGKSIEDINPDLLLKGQDSEKEFANLPVWHNKKDLDKFVQDKIKLSDEEVKNTVYDDGREKLWREVEKIIRQLRQEELIQDWANVTEGNRTGVWRLKNIVLDSNDHNIQENDEILENIKNTELSEISSEVLKKGIEEIRENFLVDGDTIREIVINIIAGRHIILAGAIGTGKTELARLIPRTFWKKHEGYHIEEYTATADWNTTDVIGGIMPKMVEDKPSYQVELGCVPSTILKNWSDSTCRARVARKTNSNTSYGTWLLIDEFNRADIDKAFGQLFTSLESKKLKVPSSKDSFSEIIIPEDYRIIATLNTADKSYLFHLSDALKRRFAYIEVNPPKRNEKEQEIYYALTNALKKIPQNNYDKYFILDHSVEQKTLVREKSDAEFIKMLDKAYNVLDFVRMSKPLGTAILKSIYQTILVSVNVSDDYGKSLDIGLRSNLIPQLENISPTSIETMIEIFFGNPINFFKKIHKNSLNKEKYEEDFKNFLKLIGTSEGDTNQAADNFLNSEISEDRWENFRIKTTDLEFSIKEKMFKKSLEEIRRTSTMI